MCGGVTWQHSCATGKKYMRKKKRAFVLGARSGCYSRMHAAGADWRQKKHEHNVFRVPFSLLVARLVCPNITLGGLVCNCLITVENKQDDSYHIKIKTNRQKHSKMRSALKWKLQTARHKKKTYIGQVLMEYSRRPNIVASKSLSTISKYMTPTYRSVALP